MEKNTFIGGVMPGGLTDHREIKILLCYVLGEIGEMRRDDLLESVAGNGLANYFECADALAAMVEAGHIAQHQDSFSVCASGKEIARILLDDLPFTVRERALSFAQKAAAHTKNSLSHKVDIVETGSGYRVRCAVCESSGSEIFSLEMNAISRPAAQRMRDRFVDNAEDIMRYCVTLLCEDIT